MNEKLASLCILGWQRPEKLYECIRTLHATADRPYELIVNLDGGDYTENLSTLVTLFSEDKISKLILVGGKNRGMGNAFQNCLGVAEGDYIFKIDGDLVFKPGWLSNAVSILENNSDIASVSLFNYRHYDPNDERFQILKEREDCLIVNDFVSSIFGFHRNRLKILGKNYLKDKMPNDGFHAELGQLGKLAITKEDMVSNTGFGYGASSYVYLDKNGEGKITEMFDFPLVFNKE